MAGVPGSSGCLGWRKSTRCSGFCARSVSTPGSTRTSRPSRSLRDRRRQHPVEHVAPLLVPQSLPHPSPQRLTQQRLTGFGPWNRLHRGVPQRLTGRRLTLSVVPRRLVVGTPACPQSTPTASAFPRKHRRAPRHAPQTPNRTPQHPARRPQTPHRGPPGRLLQVTQFGSYRKIEASRMRHRGGEFRLRHPRCRVC
jgi:hypothetical protein